MKLPAHFSSDLIAPCGMTCFACYVFLREKKACLGCRGLDQAKPGHCRECKIKTCAVEQGFDFCFQCPSFPCPISKRMDKSYRMRYQVSLIEMGMRAREIGVIEFTEEERQRWRCPICGGVVSLHDHSCSECGASATLLDTPSALC